MPGPNPQPQPEGESHIRYNDAAEALIARAQTEEAKAILRAMKVQDFLVERDESNTVSGRIILYCLSLNVWGRSSYFWFKSFYIVPHALEGDEQWMALGVYSHRNKVL